MEDTPEEQRVANRKLKQRKLGVKLGRKHIDAEKFASNSMTDLRRPAGHKPGPTTYNFAKAKLRSGHKPPVHPSPKTK